MVEKHKKMNTENTKMCSKELQIKQFIFSVVVIVVLLFVACSTDVEYDSKWIIGKTTEEIQEKYGEFDRHDEGHIFERDQKLHSSGSYLIKESRVGFMGTDPAVYYHIVFVDGVAVSVDDNYYVRGG